MEIKNGLDNERFLIAGTIGAISTVVSEIVSRILLSFGVGKYSTYQLNSLLITVGRPSVLMGLIINFIVGSIVGVTTYFILKRWGDRYTVIISIMISLVIYLIWEMVYTLGIEGKQIPIRTIGGYYNHFIVTLVYGVVIGVMLKRFIFKKV